MFHFDSDVFVPLIVFAIPIIAIVGGITAGIVKTLGQQRLLELAHRERLAAIERGVDPSKLPDIPTPEAATLRALGDLGLGQSSPDRHAQGLMIGGLVTLAVGISLAIFLYLVADGDHNVWAVGLIPGSIGIALLLSAWLVKPKRHDIGSGTPPRVG
ncbi:MAG: hypothetical protein HZC42_00825 [Candidatus Eisenbacteria bacterium]|nr:hypothetical protein [Candidatus Eisenbacteria bacterium]